MAGLAGATIVISSPAAQASVTNAVTLTATPNPVEPGDRVDLVAGMPAGDAGTLTQELAQRIDPTMVKLTEIADIVAPDGWYISVSTDGTNFTAPKLADDASWSTYANWSNVRVVKASGTIASGGSDNGLQVATGTGDGTTTSNLPGQLTGTTGDGYDAFFNAEHTMVFNIPHHQSQALSTLDCHELPSGASCIGFEDANGNPQPYPLGVTSGNMSTGRVVGTGANTRMWTIGLRPMDPATPAVGEMVWRCVDLGDVVMNTGTKAPKDCIVGGVNKSFIPITQNKTWSQTVGTYTYDFTTGHSLWVGFDGVGNEGSRTDAKIWSLNSLDGTLVCLDTATFAPCVIGGNAMPVGTTASTKGGWDLGFAYDTYADITWDEQAFAVWDGRVYIKAQLRNPAFPGGQYVTTCVMASDPTARCPGWSGANDFRTTPTGKFVELPGADGSVRGICLIWQSTVVTNRCFNASGGTFDAPASLVVNAADGPNAVSQPIRQGTRIYYGNGLGGAWSTYWSISCWDATRNSGAGGGCMGTEASPRLTWSEPTDPTKYSQYSLVPDPVYQDCLWLGQDPQPTLRTVNARTGLPGCNTLSQVVEFDGSPIVPRMGCDTEASGSAIRYWRAFTLTQPSSGFSAGSLSVKDSNGRLIDGWTDIPVRPGQRISLLDLPVSVTGQEPSFVVELADVTIVGTVNAQAKVEAVGDAPELCLSPVAQVVCPAGLSGPVSDGLLPSSPGTMRARAEGTSTLASSTVSSTPAEVDLSIMASTAADCGVLLSGTAYEAVSSGGTPVVTSPVVAGVTVTLMDSTGSSPVTYPSDWPDAGLRGQPVTTTTDENGDYSFGTLAPGSYRVSFADTTDFVAFSAAVMGPSSYGTPVLAGASMVTSSPVTLAIGSPGVVDATYVLPLTAAPDSTFGPINTNQVVYPLANDTPTSQRSLTGATLTLCGPGEVEPNCSQTSLSLAGVGTYAVSGSGPTASITFDPEPGFLGSAPPVTYQVKDAWNETATSTYTPTVFGPVAGVDDTATAAWDTNILFTPLANDTKDAANAFVPSTLKLCRQASPVETPPSCTQSSVTVPNEGTYTVNADGSVSFDPLPSFSGTVGSPVTYVVTDKAGQVATAEIIPTILDPQPPSAKPDTAAVLPVSAGGTGTVTFDPLLAPGTGALAYGAGTPVACLITPGSSPATCAAGNSVTIPGEGTYVLDPSTNRVQFTMDAAFSGSAPLTPVTYRVTDFVGQFAESTLTPVIPPQPSASADIGSGYQDVNQVISPLINDSVGSPASLDPTSVRLCGSGDTAPNCTGLTLIVSGQGTYTVDPTTGAVTFDPLPTFTGPATPVTYSVRDSVGQAASSTITPTVLALAAPQDTALPIANTDRKSGPYGQPVVLAPKGNDRAGSAPAPYSATVSATVSTVTSFSDPSLDLTSVRLCSAGEVMPNCTATSVTTVDGTYTVNTSTGEATFTPVTGFSGTVTQPVSYQISNAYTKTVETTTVTTTTTDPTATCASPDCSFTTTADANGKAPSDPGWVPTWSVTTITRAETAMSFAATALLIPTIEPPSGPRAEDDSATTPAGTPVTLDPPGNDKEGGFPLRASSLLLCGAGETAPTCTRTTVTIPGQGTFSVNTATGQVTFVPVAGFVGVATVPYRILDWNGDVADALITVTVTGAPSTPSPSAPDKPTVTVAPEPVPGPTIEATDDVNGTRAATPVAGSVALNDVFPAGSTFAIVAGPANGSVILSADGSYVYTPRLGFTGTDRFTYRVCSADALVCATANITITVAAPDAILVLPVVKPIEVGSTEPIMYSPKTRVKVASVRIAKIGKNSWRTDIVVPGKGVWTVQGTRVMFTPFPGFRGQTTIRYRVVDAQGRVAFSAFTARAAVVPGSIDAGRA